MHFEPIIGLEIHIQLKTQSKMFCSCPVQGNAILPNSNVCPICLGHPGTLPVPNEQAIRWGILMGMALGCRIASYSKFDRKHYFYPDLPKGYQISQYDMPIAAEGSMEIDVPEGPRPHLKIDITRAHLEEDAAKSFHDASGKSYVDFNRAGTPLLEIVTEPDFRTPHEAKIFLQELRLMARTLGISDADMEKGQLRCDANISLRQFDEEGNIVGAFLNPKTEVKNMNSFRAVERALEHEIRRQTDLWEKGTPPSLSSTRGWNDVTQSTEPQRTKEQAEDYRYFPEPDIPPMELTELADAIRGTLPELPAAKRMRLVSEYGLTAGDARILCEEPVLANYAEHVFSELHAWIQSLPEFDGAEETVLEREHKKVAKLVSGWLISKLGGILKERGIGIRDAKIDPENFAEFITLLATGKLSTQNGLAILTEMFGTGRDPSHIMEEKHLGLVSDEGIIAEVVSRVVEQHQTEATRYKNGEKQLLAFFIGLIMKETGGKADPGMARNMLLVELEKTSSSFFL